MKNFRTLSCLMFMLLLLPHGTHEQLLDLPTDSQGFFHNKESYRYLVDESRKWKTL